MPHRPLPRPSTRLFTVDPDRVVGWAMAVALPLALAYAWFTR
jgi:hypothetical protein